MNKRNGKGKKIGNTGLSRQQLEQRLEDGRKRFRQDLVDEEYYLDSPSYATLRVWKDGEITVYHNSTGEDDDKEAITLIAVKTDALDEETDDCITSYDEWTENVNDTKLEKYYNGDITIEDLVGTEEYNRIRVAVIDQNITAAEYWNIDSVIGWLEEEEAETE